MKYDLTIIGAGVVGLNTAYEYQKRYPHHSIAVIEKEGKPGAHQTGNNSGVIHSGIYYKPGSQKASNCRLGIKNLQSFAREHEIPFETCGKLIVATNQDEIPRLDTLYNRGLANGLQGLKPVGRSEIQEVEPHVTGMRALFVPETGIIDYTQVANFLKNVLIEKGCDLFFDKIALDIHESSNEVVITTNRNDIQTKTLVNCGGLYSDRIAKWTEKVLDVKIIPFRGEYWTLKPGSRHLVKNLIYPVPDPRFPFLGVHFTRRMNGEVEAGPNAVLAMAREGYERSVVSLKDISEMMFYPGLWRMAGKYWKTGFGEQWRSFVNPAFVKALQKLIPEVTSNDLAPGGSGVRAQAVTRGGKLVDDFMFRSSEKVLHVLNAPSPAATASFAIAETIVNQLSGDIHHGQGNELIRY